MSTVGDKIGLTAPTVGGSTDTWGTENNSLWTLMDEVIYCSREDRNNIVMGGGKISWDGTNVTFTSSIDVINHITAFKNSVTTAGSPVALNATGRVGYVQLSRKPGSDNNITAVTVVSSGSLPNGTADADMGTVALFYRTVDSTIWIPWARREILSGDHWQFGAAQSWYERLASRAKPGFKSNTADTSQLIVPGSAASPAVVFIDGKLYANVANATLDLDTAGRNGLDTGAKAANTAYYLYAIPAASGRTFDLVCSVTAPSGAGPTGFSSWSYIGAFTTFAASGINPFTSANGVYIAAQPLSATSTTSSTTYVSRTLSPCPSTVKAIYGYVSVTGTAVGARANVSGSGTTNDLDLYVRLQVSGNENDAFGWIEAVNGTQIFCSVSSASNACIFNQYGYSEDPMEYK